MRRSLAWLATAALTLGNLACGETEPKRGSLMLAVSTDMYINKDLGRVDIIVQPEHGPTQSVEVNLFPELDGKFLPGTFAVIEGETPGEFVRVRVIARKGNSVRVVREAATRIPRERSALLPMPIQWLCDGKVKEEGQLHRSDCDEDYTCVGGVCKSAVVDETTLDDYVPELIFGGGNATGGGECFDTLECFPEPTLAELDLETCQVDAPAGDSANVAVVLPPGSDGHCGSQSEGCLIPLDESDLSGWTRTSGGRLELPAGVCERIDEGSALGVIVSDRCDSKEPNTPTCGPWTLVGTLPGEDPDPIGPVDPNPPGTDPTGDPAPALAATTEAVDGLADIAGKACAALLGMTLPEPPTADEASDLCNRAKESLLVHLPVQWHYTPSRCWVGAESQLACERECDPTCDPGSLEGRCEVNSVVGQCDGVCESRLCLGNDNVSLACQGYCAGECDGQCEGNCFGACEAGCSQTMPSGYCDGFCTEHCTGLCEGRCDGQCTGHCNGDPTLAATTCNGDCAGGCDTTLARTKCEGPLGFSPCNLEPICQSGCRARGFADMQCDRATTWVMPQEGLSEDTRAALEENIPDLIPAFEIRIPALQQVTTELSLSLEFDADFYADDLGKTQELTDNLNALWTSLEQLLRSLGDSRGAGLLGGPGVDPGPGPGPSEIDCTPLISAGSAPLIDDFEDANDFLPRNDGRDGQWYFFNDGTGQQYPMGPLIPEPDPTDTFALHTWGSNFTSWGAGVGVDFRLGGAPYDASRYRGFRFRARGNTSLWVILRQADIMNDGHPCGGCDPDVMTCDWFHRTELFLSDQWTLFDLPWTNFQNQFGPETPVNTAVLTSIEFETPASTAFDFWIDDVEFY